MAELVQKNLEEMIPEINCLEKTELLDKTERDNLIRDRRHFEYRLAKMAKTKSDFIQYASFDICLLEKISEKRKTMNVVAYTNEIEATIRKRIVKRLKDLTYSFPTDVNCWNFRINFCKSTKELNHLVTAIYDEEVKLLGKYESLWIEWAKWEMIGNNNFAEARKILLSLASMYHPNSLYIAKEHFRLELLYIEYLLKMTKESELEGLEDIPMENREKILKGAVANICYEKNMEKLNRAEVNKEFYLIAEKFSFAEELREKICNDMKELYPKEADTWVIQARRKLKNIKKNKLITKVFEELDHGLKEVGSSFIETYINEMLNLLFHFWQYETVGDMISEKLQSILAANKEQLKTSFPWILWICLLEIKPDADNEDKRDEISKDAIKKVPCCSFLRNYIDNRGLLEAETCILKMKGIKACQKYYRENCCKTPISLNLHYNMLIRELGRKEISPEDIRFVFRTAIRQFGKTNPGLWLTYIQFERKYGKSSTVNELSLEAKWTLPVEELDEFKKLRYCIDNQQDQQPDEVEEDVSKKALTSWKPSIVVDGLNKASKSNQILLPERSDARQDFFQKLSKIERGLTPVVTKKVGEKKWRPILESILGKKLSFAQVDIKSSRPYVEEKTSNDLSALANSVAKVAINYSTELNDRSEYGPVINTDLEELLKKSDLLNPNFLAQKTLPKYHESKFSKKNKKKNNTPTTAGKGWYDMGRPEMTDEIRRDLSVFNMRSILLPDRHYKKNLQRNPKFFQMGKVLDSSYDWYNRVPKKQRKKTFAEEIMASEEIMSYQKRKFSQISSIEDSKNKRLKMAKNHGKKNTKK